MSARSSCGVAAFAVSALVGLPVAEGADSSSPGGKRPVFHHICENSQLSGILKAHRPSAPTTAPDKPSQPAFCVVGDFGFTEAEIYVELLSVPGAGMLWILDGAARPEALATAAPAVTIELTEHLLKLGGRGLPPIERPSRAGADWRFWLLVGKGRLAILDARSERLMTPPEGIALNGPLYVAVPSQDGACSNGCGPTALDIFLDGSERRRWFRTIRRPAGTPGDPTPSAAVDAFIGQYGYEHVVKVFESAGVEDVATEDTLTISLVDDGQVHFAFELWFDNGHRCAMEGMARYLAGYLEFREALGKPTEAVQECVLRIRRTADGVLLEDVRQACALQAGHCGVRGGIGGAILSKRD